MSDSQEFKSHGMSQSGSQNGYSVEARYNFPDPIQIGKQLFDNRWRKVTFESCQHGVPSNNRYDFALQLTGLLSYPAAQALRWWLHAEAEALGVGGLCLETRIIQHKVAYNIKADPVEAVMPIGGDDRSNSIPNWGVKSQPKQTNQEALKE